MNIIRPYNNYVFNKSHMFLNAALEDSVAYHVTYLSNLSSIAKTGLDPNLGGRYHAIGYRGRAKGKIFFGGNLEAAKGWISALWEHSETEADPYDLHDPARIPWILALDIKNSKVVEDELGGARVEESFYTEHNIPPQRIRFWSPVLSEWTPIRKYSEHLAPVEFSIREINPVEDKWLDEDEWNGLPWYELNEEAWDSVPEAI